MRAGGGREGSAGGAPALGFELLDASAPAASEPHPIAAAALDGRLGIPDFPVALSLDAIPRPAERFERAELAALAARLERCLTTLRPHVAVLDAIRDLGEPGACVVVTGQQPGLLSSPLLSLYKALQAVRLARRLRQAWKRPVVALFWNHADDHDVAEVHHTWLLNENLDLQRVGLAGLSSGRQPVGRIRMDEEKHGLIAMRALLEQAFVRSVNDSGRRARGQRAVDQLLPRQGETLATAFTRALIGLLGHLGLVVLEPEWIREELSRALGVVVAQRPAEHLREGARALHEAGFEAPIDPDGAALLYRLDERGRHALRPGGEGFRYDDESGSRTAEELAAEIVRDLHAWSPGALLRPIVQDMCLPVAAYVGGAGELAYHAQLPALRRAVGAPVTAFVPRRSCSLVEPETVASLARLGVDAADVLEGRLQHALSGDADADGPPAALEALRRAGERAAEELQGPSEELARFDRALARNLARTASQVRAMVDKLVAKGERVYQNSSGKGRRHVRRVENSLLPRGLPQERVLGPLPYLARFGADWIDELCAQLDPFDMRHLVATFLPESPARGDERADDRPESAADGEDA